MRSDRLRYQSIYVSLQGEGPNTGLPSVFVRFAGCNLGCSYCDSRRAWDELYERQWKEHTVATVVERVLDIKGRAINMVLTGGEPLLQMRPLESLVRSLYNKFYFFEVETNGTILPSQALAKMEKVYFNVSPKLANSGIERERRLDMNVLKFFADHERSIFKFVVSSRADVEEVMDIVNELMLERDRVYLMPLASTRSQLERVAPTVARLAGRYGLSYTDRLHLRLNMP